MYRLEPTKSGYLSRSFEHSRPEISYRWSSKNENRVIMTKMMFWPLSPRSTEAEASGYYNRFTGPIEDFVHESGRAFNSCSLLAGCYQNEKQSNQAQQTM